MTESCIVSVVGKGRDCSTEVRSLAFDVGYMLGSLDSREHPVVLVTGGLGGVMAAAAKGFTSWDGRLALALRPGDGDAWEGEGNTIADASYPALIVNTGLPYAVRNVVTATCCALMVVLPGSHGTLQEALVALDRGVPVLVLGDHSDSPSRVLADAYGAVHLCDVGDFIERVTLLIAG